MKRAHESIALARRIGDDHVLLDVLHDGMAALVDFEHPRIRGAIFDVAVDLRPQSPAFRRWTGIELSADNRRALYIPAGCAHGFQTLTPDAEVLYMIDAPYSAAHGRGVRWNDPAFGIVWPEAARVMNDRDAGYADFSG